MLRGYLALVAFAVLLAASWSPSYTFMPIIDTSETTLVLLVALIGGSVALGLRRRPATPRTVIANLVLALFLPVALTQTLGQPLESSPVETIVQDEAPPGLSYAGAEVTNVYPYDRRGRLLQDVRLFDQDGRPLDLGGPASPDPDRRVPVTATGREVFNAFPLRYFEAGTRRIAEPDAGSRRSRGGS